MSLHERQSYSGRCQPCPPLTQQNLFFSHRDLLPGLVQETVDIEVELFEKYQRKCDLWPLEAVKSFQLLYRQK